MIRDMFWSVIFSFLQEIESLQTFTLENLFLAAAAPCLDNQLNVRLFTGLIGLHCTFMFQWITGIANYFSIFFCWCDNSLVDLGIHIHKVYFF